ncbi:MAG: thrombospondin type 3 repeat-containing protein [Pseudomonadota bacterium]
MNLRHIASITLMALPAQATLAETFDNALAFHAAAPGLQTEGFDSLPVGAEVEFLPCIGIQFEDPGDGFPEVVAGLGSSPSSPPNSLANRPISTASTQPIRLARIDGAPITAAGIYNSTSDDQLRLSLLDGDGNTIESLIIDPQPAPRFGGIVSAVGAATVEIAWTGAAGNGLHGFDDLQISAGLSASQDADGDGIEDTIDNCALVANPTQLDTDGDSFGNACDADLNNDCSVNFTDLGDMKAVFFQAGDLAADLNGDGSVNFFDLGIMKASFFGAPGPSCPTVCVP